MVVNIESVACAKKKKHMKLNPTDLFNEEVFLMDDPVLTSLNNDMWLP